jgi:hypothetical protein
MLDQAVIYTTDPSPPHRAKCYDRTGHIVGTLTHQKLLDLWKRYHLAEETGQHSESTVGTFEEEIILLLRRYPISGDTDKDKRAQLINHWTTPPQFMDAIRAGLGTTMECFASPLNVNPATIHHCSKYNEDKVFNSLGNAYDMRLKGSFEFNPKRVHTDRTSKSHKVGGHSGQTRNRTRIWGGNIPNLERHRRTQNAMKYLEAEYSGFAYLVKIPPGAKFNFSAPDVWTRQKSVFNTGNNTH